MASMRYIRAAKVEKLQPLPVSDSHVVPEGECAKVNAPVASPVVQAVEVDPVEVSIEARAMPPPPV